MRLSDDDIALELQVMRGWTLESRLIKRTIHFENFMSGLEFIKKVAKEAEKMNHHPDVMLKYREVTFVLTTHDEHGITEKDIALAKRIDEMLGR